MWHDNFMVIKFYSLPLNRLDKKLTGFNFMEAQFRAQCHSNITVDFLDYNFTVLPLTLKP